METSAELYSKRQTAHQQTQKAFAEMKSADQLAQEHERLGNTAATCDERNGHYAQSREARNEWRRANHDFMLYMEAYLKSLDELQRRGFA